MSSLIVLDSEEVPTCADVYGELRWHPGIRQAFSFEFFTTDLGRALEEVRGKEDVVVVVGPTFLKEYTEKRGEMIHALFAKAGLPDKRLVVVHYFDDSSSMTCEWQRRVMYDPIPDVVVRASGKSAFCM